MCVCIYLYIYIHTYIHSKHGACWTQGVPLCCNFRRSEPATRMVKNWRVLMYKPAEPRSSPGFTEAHTHPSDRRAPCSGHEVVPTSLRRRLRVLHVRAGHRKVPHGDLQDDARVSQYRVQGSGLGVRGLGLGPSFGLGLFWVGAGSG